MPMGGAQQQHQQKLAKRSPSLTRREAPLLPTTRVPPPGTPPKTPPGTHSSTAATLRRWYIRATVLFAACLLLVGLQSTTTPAGYLRDSGVRNNSHVYIFVSDWDRVNTFYTHLLEPWLDGDMCEGAGVPFRGVYIVDPAQVHPSDCDAVLFHAPTAAPGFRSKHWRIAMLWYWVFTSNERTYMSQRDPRTKTILMNHEPGFDYADKKYHPDLTMNFHRSSSIYFPFYGCSFYSMLRKGERPPPNPADRRGAVMFVSNPIEPRMSMLAALMDLVSIDSYGKVLHNVDAVADRKSHHRIDSKRQTLSSYRVTMAFESRRIPDYVTEKVFDALETDTVPVYWGAVEITEYLPLGSYINANDYTTTNITKLADEINKILNDDETYLAYLSRKWQNPGAIDPTIVRACAPTGQCEPFKAVHERREEFSDSTFLHSRIRF